MMAEQSDCEQLCMQINAYGRHSFTSLVSCPWSPDIHAKWDTLLMRQIEADLELT